MIKIYVHIPGIGKREIETDEEQMKGKNVSEAASLWFNETGDFTSIRLPLKNKTQIILRGDTYKNSVFEFVDE